MELGSAVASGVGIGVLLGSESDGSAGFELGEEKRECDGVSVGDPHRPKARPLTSSSSSTDVELGVEFDGASAVASSDAQAAKVQAVGQRCPRGESPRRTER